jgi:hypothetical protein
LVAHEKIINIITTMIDSDNLPHLLLYGPPGTGKTSTIVAAAKRMYGASKYSSMTLELNASDARGINVVRNEIKEFAGTQQLFSKGIKLIILDEADAMTSDAQFARPLLSDLQLCFQDYPGPSIAVHTVSVRPLAPQPDPGSTRRGGSRRKGSHHRGRNPGHS